MEIVGAEDDGPIKASLLQTIAIGLTCRVLRDVINFKCDMVTAVSTAAPNKALQCFIEAHAYVLSFTEKMETCLKFCKEHGVDDTLVQATLKTTRANMDERLIDGSVKVFKKVAESMVLETTKVTSSPASNVLELVKEAKGIYDEAFSVKINAALKTNTTRTFRLAYKQLELARAYRLQFQEKLQSIGDMELSVDQQIAQWAGIAVDQLKQATTVQAAYVACSAIWRPLGKNESREHLIDVAKQVVENTLRASLPSEFTALLGQGVEVASALAIVPAPAPAADPVAQKAQPKREL